VLDKDLQAIQEARTLVAQVSAAQKELAKFSQEKIDAIVAAMAQAAHREAERLARMAYEETGYGNVGDKTLKNLFSSDIVYDYIKGLKTIGILREDKENKIIEIAHPVGVVAAVIPSTNPTSTTICKALISIKAGNGVVFSPHPSAVKCISETARLLYEAALAAGAPKGIIACMTAPTIEGTQELMKHRLTGVILATGGPGLVRAAYSSGRPAIGVGPGNVPAFIERTADVKKAVRDVIAGKTFDYGTLCSSENSVIVDEPIHNQVVEEFKKNGGYFCTAAEAAALSKVVVNPDRHLNTQIVGKPATFIAQKAGIPAPEGTRVLIARLEGVGRDYPLSIEKLSPILSYYVVKGWREGCQRCIQVLNYGGMGHTLALHSNDMEVIKAFGLEKPAFRIVVNTLASIGAVGYTTNLVPSMTLGCGSVGGNITSDNIGPLNLINIKRVAFETKPFTSKTTSAEVKSSAIGKVSREVIREIVDELLSRRVAQVAGGSALPAAPTPSQPKKNPEPSPVAQKRAEAPARRTADFVSEADVRAAISRNEKIQIGSRTLITPLARDLGNEQGIFIYE
jgi:acetaldehyde dehydrogenase (acetylating)